MEAPCGLGFTVQQRQQHRHPRNQDTKGPLAGPRGFEGQQQRKEVGRARGRLPGTQGLAQGIQERAPAGAHGRPRWASIPEEGGLNGAAVLARGCPPGGLLGSRTSSSGCPGLEECKGDKDNQLCLLKWLLKLLSRSTRPSVATSHLVSWQRMYQFLQLHRVSPGLCQWLSLCSLGQQHQQRLGACRGHTGQYTDLTTEKPSPETSMIMSPNVTPIN